MNLLRGILGAATGFATGGPGGAVASGLGGLFGGSGQHEDPTMRAMRLQQQGIANQLLGYANSVPGSSPDELANFAQSRGELGALQRQQQQRIFGAYDPNQRANAPNLLQNLTNSNIAQQMAQHAGFLQNASANRRQALQNAASIGQGAASLYRPQPDQFGQSMAQLAQLLAYQQARKQGQNGGAVGGTLPGETPAPGVGPVQGPGLPPVTSSTSGVAAVPGTPEWWSLLGPMLGDPNLGTGPVPMAEQPSAAVQAVNAQTGQQAPGQVINGVNNQIRQSNGFSTPAAPGLPGGWDVNMLSALARQLIGPAGMRLGY
jgi:hypothetical protein